MLHFLKKNLSLNYIFPPYQPIDINTVSTDAKSNVRITQYDLGEPFNESMPVSIDEMQIDKIYQCI